MFGHQDDQHHHHDDDNKTENVLTEPGVDHVLDGSLETGHEHPTTVVGSDSNPALPLSDNAPTDDAIAPSAPDANVTPTNDAAGNAATADNSALLSIKQQALTSLSPLVDHLDQTPEEKFRTTMMMIQASDNQDLIKNAFDAAQSIPDEKVKAQALLDIVNEINYFTQQTA